MKKFDYYLKLRELGIKEKHAVKMVKQANASARLDADSLETASAAVMEFATWAGTEEGDGYWDKLYYKYGGE